MSWRKRADARRRPPLTALDGGPQAAPRRDQSARWDAPPLVEITSTGQRYLVQPVAERVMARTPLNTPRQTWNWLWKDTLERIIPFYLAVWVYQRFTPWGRDDLALRADAPLADLATGVAAGLPLALIAAVFRRSVAPRYALPTSADQLAQSAFYFLVNAPAEELFFRGAIQPLATRGLRKVPGLRRAAGLLGWAVATALYGGYHRLGGWSWRSIAGVTAAGGLLGAMTGAPRRRSLWPAIIAHGFATAGFLSWGDVALYRRDLARQRRQYAQADTNTRRAQAGQ